jgi:hypothetical protein
MRRYNLNIVLVIMLIVTTNNSALALEEKTVNGVIVHESTNPKLTANFIEDVVSLLPPEMVKTLEPHLKTLNREAAFHVGGDYWRRQVISRDDFKKRFEGISIHDGNELASQLGGSVKHIFEIALRPDNSDVLNEVLQKNLREVPTQWKRDTFTVVYDGYSGQSLDVILSNLYGYKKRHKMTLYPDLVLTTANLWSAIWQINGGKMELVTKTFVRKPAEINFRKTPGSVSTPSYRR